MHRPSNRSANSTQMRSQGIARGLLVDHTLEKRGEESKGRTVDGARNRGASSQWAGKNLGREKEHRDTAMGPSLPPLPPSWQK